MPDKGIAGGDETSETQSARLTTIPAELRDWAHLQLRQLLGTGAFGEVFRAWDPQLQREVALKLLLSNPGLDADAALREGRMLARLRHPNVVSVFGAARALERVGFWMEFVNGCTLAELVRQRGKLGASEAAAIGIEVCRALAAVHGAGLIHRDVKAQNVMREDGGRILLADFGLGMEAAQMEACAGTPAYMAPETLLRGEASRSTDLYSLGVLLFYLTTRSFPVDVTSRETLLAWHKEGRRRHLRDLRPDLPADFIRVVEKAIAPEARARYDSAGEMEEALGLSSGQPGGAAARGLHERPADGAAHDSTADTRAWLGRWRRGWRASVLLAAVATLVGVSAWRMGDRAPRPTPAPVALPAPATAISLPLSVDAQLFRKRNATTDELLNPLARLAVDDRLFLKVRLNQSACLYVVNEDDAGQVYLLFPLPGAHANPMPAGGPFELPGTIGGKEQHWVVTSAGRRERVMVVASPTRLADLEEALRGLPPPRSGELGVRVSEPAGARLRGIGGLAPSDRSSDGWRTKLSQVASQGAASQQVWVRVFELSNP